MYDNKNYFVHIKTLNVALNYRLILEKCIGWTNLNQEAWLKPDIEINTELRTKAKTNFENNFLKVMTNSVFGITIKNVRDHRDIKILTKQKQAGIRAWPKYNKAVL